MCRRQCESSLEISLFQVDKPFQVRRAASSCQTDGQGQMMAESAHSTPTTPSTRRSSPVIVPVLSKQQTSTLPAEGIRKGSTQKMAADCRESEADWAGSTRPELTEFGQCDERRIDCH